MIYFICAPGDVLNIVPEKDIEEYFDANDIQLYRTDGFKIEEHMRFSNGNQAWGRV